MSSLPRPPPPPPASCLAGELANAAALASTAPRPAPNHKLLKKLGLLKPSGPDPSACPKKKSRKHKSRSAARVPVEAERVILPLSQAIAISPDDDVLRAIERGQQNAAANLEGPSSQRLATKFSAATLALSAQGEPQVVGTWRNGGFVWTGEHRLSGSHDQPRSSSSTSLAGPSTPTSRRTPTPGADDSPSRPARPQVKLQIPANNARGLPTSMPVLVDHQKSEFAEYGYVSPISDDDNDDDDNSKGGDDDGLPVLGHSNSQRSAAADGGTFFTDSEESSPVSLNSKDDFDVRYQSSETSPSSQESLGRLRVPLRKAASDNHLEEDDEARDEVASLKPVPLKRAGTYQPPPLSSKNTVSRSAPARPMSLKEWEIEELMYDMNRNSIDSARSSYYGQQDIAISSNDAERVIIKIFQGCSTLRDLFSLAMVNRGFYKVFKQHELKLMQSVLRNESPPAWEMRMASQGPYTAKTFVQYLKLDSLTLTELKSLILGRCQSYVRPETLHALSTRDPQGSKNIDDALWRIWSFCELFGPETCQEEDITAQTDWLRGGAASRNRSSAPEQSARGASLETGDEQTDVRPTSYVPPPRHFGGGNGPHGLTAEQLYDMTEIWNCLEALLGGILGHDRPGRSKQARQFMVFNNPDMYPDEGDAREDELLEEWVYYLLTLGPSVVLDLAAKADSPTNDVFKFAREMAWSKWSLLPSGASRRTFLKEAVTRVYKERSQTSPQDPTSAKEVQSQLQRRRTQRKAWASELKERRAQGAYKDVPFTNEERPMSIWLENQEAEAALEGRPSQQKQAADESEEASEEEDPTTPLQTSYKITDFSVSLPQLDGMVPDDATGFAELEAHTPPQQRKRTQSVVTYAPSTTSTARVSSPPKTSSRRSSVARASTLNGLRSVYNTSSVNLSTFDASSVHPAFRNSPPNTGESHFGQRPQDLNGRAEEPDRKNSVDRFIFNIVEMGFTPADARRALGATDNGHSLDVQRAIDWLLQHTDRRATVS